MSPEAGRGGRGGGNSRIAVRKHGHNRAAHASGMHTQGGLRGPFISNWRSHSCVRRWRRHARHDNGIFIGINEAGDTGSSGPGEMAISPTIRRGGCESSGGKQGTPNRERPPHSETQLEIGDARKYVAEEDMVLFAGPTRPRPVERGAAQVASPRPLGASPDSTIISHCFVLSCFMNSHVLTWLVTFPAWQDRCGSDAAMLWSAWPIMALTDTWSPVSPPIVSEAVAEGVEAAMPVDVDGQQLGERLAHGPVDARHLRAALSSTNRPSRNQGCRRCVRKTYLSCSGSLAFSGRTAR